MTKGQLKYIYKYPVCFDSVDKFKDFEYHIEWDPRFKSKIQTPHVEILSLESVLKDEFHQR